jgi:hypothetical protein
VGDLGTAAFAALGTAAIATLAATAGLSVGAAAQTVQGLDPHVHARASNVPVSLQLEWNAMPGVAAFQVSRRATGADRWVPLDGGTLPGTATGFIDGDVQSGQLYEYRVEDRLGAGQGGGAYLLGGIDVPFPVDQGVVLLVIDDSMASPLAAELDRLQADLEAEGWQVKRELVAESDAPSTVRAVIQADHAMYGSRLNSALLLGGVPRAYSGSIHPDEHPDHLCAWPADGYYGDVDGRWADMQSLGGSPSGPCPNNPNNPGDGQFDPSYYPTPLEIAVGRVDTLNLPAFAAGPDGGVDAGLDATELLRRYLDHDHLYRTGAVQIPSRAFVSDNFGFVSGEAFARVGWRDATAIYGVEPDQGSPFFDALEADGGYAFATGCGGGYPAGASGVGDTTDFVNRAPNAVYIGLFGSYFGDWHFDDDFLRSALLSRGVTLATTWFARPYTHLHGLGALETFGQVFLTSANNFATATEPQEPYDTDGVAAGFGGMVHQALLGDPTLRMFVVRGPSNLTATAGVQSAALSWGPSPDPVVGYHVFRRLVGQDVSEVLRTATPVTDTSYVDSPATPGLAYAYRVVAVQHLTTGSGTFFNHSPGPIAIATPLGAAAPDAGVVDAGLPDTDAGPAVGPPPAGHTGCGNPGPLALSGLLLAALWLGKRRRDRQAA